MASIRDTITSFALTVCCRPRVRGARAQVVGVAARIHVQPGAAAIVNGPADQRRPRLPVTDRAGGSEIERPLLPSFHPQLQSMVLWIRVPRPPSLRDLASQAFGTLKNSALTHLPSPLLRRQLPVSMLHGHLLRRIEVSMTSTWDLVSLSRFFSRYLGSTVEIQ